MQAYQLRVIDEYAELTHKVNTLQQFLFTDKSKDILPEEKKLLTSQHNIMRDYLSVLRERMRLW